MAAKAEFLLIAFRFAKERKVKSLEPAFDKALDWMRISDTCWLVWTTSTPAQWDARLKPYIDKQDCCYIVAIDVTQESGQLYRWQWDWIKKHRDRGQSAPSSAPMPRKP